MAREWDTVFVLGPPAAGKTTLGSAAAKRLCATFRTIDDWTPRKRRMSDPEVQIALARLFDATNPKNEIVEFAHHDYETLLGQPECHIFKASRKIFVTAPLGVCQARNAARKSPVNPLYVERAWFSTQSLLQRCSTANPSSVIVLDSTTHTIDALVTKAVSFVSKKEARSC